VVAGEGRGATGTRRIKKWLRQNPEYVPEGLFVNGCRLIYKKDSGKLLVKERLKAEQRRMSSAQSRSGMNVRWL
jgi:hypothetical protein